MVSAFDLGAIVNATTLIKTPDANACSSTPIAASPYASPRVTDA